MPEPITGRVLTPAEDYSRRIHRTIEYVDELLAGRLDGLSEDTVRFALKAVKGSLVTPMDCCDSHADLYDQERLGTANHNANCSPWCEGDHPPSEVAPARLSPSDKAGYLK